MDSRNYEELISGSRPHWQQLDVDGTGFGVGVTWVLDVLEFAYLVHTPSYATQGIQSKPEWSSQVSHDCWKCIP